MYSIVQPVFLGSAPSLAAGSSLSLTLLLFALPPPGPFIAFTDGLLKAPKDQYMRIQLKLANTERGKKSLEVLLPPGAKDDEQPFRLTDEQVNALGKMDDPNKKVLQSYEQVSCSG